MSVFQVQARRLLLAAGIGLAAVGGPALAVTAMPASTPLAECTGGEEADVYTTTCVPMLVPNSPDDDGFTTNAANPDIPEIDGIPCTGRDSGTCIGLAEEQQAMGPQPVPRSTISSSP
ncbi:intersectin-EH binding protein Ibp1 [Mycolicibacterium sp. 120270]|uniref:intersectin-EH binding protein Ibp1 n=1 Tax=Mycolicibacterium sp. 120270 TaxID=3090600 RepID=UPI00299DE348|nr:intersectin-EH binding protein Ibp1 [Mycolicibacterium sp. 120270]MDX1885586.1 intersectin-EH binding protein Ibp1 [Mycolicibacterium sp. 120270]